MVEQLLGEITPGITLNAAAQAKLQQSISSPMTGNPGSFCRHRTGGIASSCKSRGELASSGKTVEWKIVDSQSVEEVWPVGWKPAKAPKDMCPIC